MSFIESLGALLSILLKCKWLFVNISELEIRGK